MVFLSCLAFGFNNCYKDKLDKIESQTSSSTMTQARPSPNTRSTPTINPSPNPEINQSLLKAIFMEGNINKVREALNNGADVNLQDNFGRTALMLAIEMNRDNIKIVKLLLAAGADTGIQTTKRVPGYELSFYRPGMTALMYASNKGHIDIVRALLEAGANVNLRNMDLKTALTMAKEIGRTKIVELLEAAGATE